MQENESLDEQQSLNEIKYKDKKDNATSLKR